MNAIALPAATRHWGNSPFLPLLCLAFSFLYGCATTYSIPEEQRERIDRVGAVSLLGDDVRVLYEGTISVLDHNSALHDTKKWSIDEYALQTLAQTVSQDSPFTYVQLDIDKGALFSIYDPLTEDVRSKKYDLRRIKEGLRGIGTKYDLDALLIILETDNFSRSTVGGMQVNLVAGYGISRKSFLGIPFQATHAVTRVVFIDTNTLEDVACVDILNYETIEKAAWNLDFDKLPSSKQTKIEKAIKKQLRDNLTYAIKTLSGTDTHRGGTWSGYFQRHSCDDHHPITPKKVASSRADTR